MLVLFSFRKYTAPRSLHHTEPIPPYRNMADHSIENWNLFVNDPSSREEFLAGSKSVFRKQSSLGMINCVFRGRRIAAEHQFKRLEVIRPRCVRFSAVAQAFDPMPLDVHHTFHNCTAQRTTP